jgi:hypothetical protein
MTASVLVKHRLYCVAGQGFEPWKASADGFTVRCQGTFAQRERHRANPRGAVSRALAAKTR